MTINAVWRAIAVDNAQSPYDRIQLKVFYPANQTKSLPVVIFFSGINCNLAMYEWMARELAPQGMIVILFNWLAENIPGQIALTPGVNLAAYAPEAYGTIPTASAFPTLLAELELLNCSGKLANRLDLQQIILGGHSAGGRVAIENANSEFFSQVAGAFSYGGHTAAPIQLGGEPGTILPLQNTTPVLLIGGTQDGVIANNAQIYGLDRWQSPTTPVERTFREAIARQKDDSYLVILEGANHFAICDRHDPTLQVAGLDFATTQPPAKIRSVMAEMIILFIELHVRQQSQAAGKLQRLLTDNSSLIASFEKK
ncbi:MAG: dienelactone hydrolase [Cyanobacteria bacterium J06638_38]